MQYSGFCLRRRCLACRTMAKLRCTARLWTGTELRQPRGTPTPTPPTREPRAQPWGTYLARERLQLPAGSPRPVGEGAASRLVLPLPPAALHSHRGAHSRHMHRCPPRETACPPLRVGSSTLPRPWQTRPGAGRPVQGPDLAAAQGPHLSAGGPRTGRCGWWWGAPCHLPLPGAGPRELPLAS